jgi:hypothetical protein
VGADRKRLARRIKMFGGMVMVRMMGMIIWTSVMEGRRGKMTDASLIFGMDVDGNGDDIGGDGPGR